MQRSTLEVALIVFGRVPVIEAVKSRLAAGLGRSAATAVYELIARGTFEAAEACGHLIIFASLLWFIQR